MSETPPSSANRTLRENPLIPHPLRLSDSEPDYTLIMAAHDSAVATGDDGYLDPRTGFYVMTAPCHVRRGWCCTSGCRHCPFVQG